MDQLNSSSKFDNFERTTRQIRWLSIVVVLLTFPSSAPQAPYAYGLLALAALYNALRYVTPIQRLAAFRSPISMLVVDTLFAGALITCAGYINSPYSAFLIFMVVTAAYLYQMPGTVAIVILETLILFSVTVHPLVTPIMLDRVRIISIIIFALLALGFLVERLTHSDRVERDSLKKLRQKSEQERSRLLTLVDSLSNAIFVTDSKGRIAQTNEAARLLADNPTDLVGQEFSKVLPLHQRNNQADQLVDILHDTTSTGHRRDLSTTTHDDTQIDLDINITPVNVSGRATEYIVVCEDISQERSLDEQRSEFISVASHELRTPLAIVEAALESSLVSSDKLPARTKLILEQAHRNSLQLANIIKDLTILAESQNDNIPVHLTRINPAEILHEAAADFVAQAEQKGITLQQTVAPDAPNVLSTEHHVREILQNYLTNAIKYSSGGSVTLRAEPAKNGGILFSVQDEGIGISRHDQKLLFTKFFRAEDYRTRTTGGTGLGLYLCMELAARLGAKLWCKSKLNEGSTFYFEVPQQSTLRRDQSEVVRAQVANLVDEL